MSTHNEDAVHATRPTGEWRGARADIDYDSGTVTLRNRKGEVVDTITGGVTALDGGKWTLGDGHTMTRARCGCGGTQWIAR